MIDMKNPQLSRVAGQLVNEMRFLALLSILPSTDVETTIDQLSTSKIQTIDELRKFVASRLPIEHIRSIRQVSPR